MKKYEVTVQELHTYTVLVEAVSEDAAREEALRKQKEGLYLDTDTVVPTKAKEWDVIEITTLDRDLYGVQLSELLDNPAMSPQETLKVCIRIEASAELANTHYNLGNLTEQEYLDKIEDIKNIMQKAGMDTSVLEFDSDPRGIAIKVKKEDWPYRDVMSGIPVLIHESLH